MATEGADTAVEAVEVAVEVVEAAEVVMAADGMSSVLRSSSFSSVTARLRMAASSCARSSSALRDRML